MLCTAVAASAAGNSLVTFQVDLTAASTNGQFTPGTSLIYARGTFNNWSTGAYYDGSGSSALTNDPAASGLATNIYSGTFSDTTDGNGFWLDYKFYIDTGSTWESPASTGGNNRVLHLGTNSSMVLPLVYFDDQALSDYLTEDTEVTFSVNMTNAVCTDGHVFDASADQVFLNGQFLGWLGWNTIALTPYQLTNNPVGGTNYSIKLLVPKGQPLALTYKYGVYHGDNPSGLDIEAPQNQNHFRYVRVLSNYSMPLDKFGNQYAEPSFGQLNAGHPSAGSVPLSWLGRPGVCLQTATSLTSPITWTTHLDTAGLGPPNGSISTNGFISLTNYPATGSSKTFFRLVKP